MRGLEAGVSILETWVEYGDETDPRLVLVRDDHELCQDAVPACLHPVLRARSCAPEPPARRQLAARLDELQIRVVVGRHNPEVDMTSTQTRRGEESRAFADE